MFTYEQHAIVQLLYADIDDRHERISDPFIWFIYCLFCITMSSKINRVDWRLILGFAVSLVAILSLAGVSLLVAIGAVVVIATQTVSGAFIYARLPRTKSPIISEYLGMGFAIGFALSTLSDVFLKSTSIRSVAWLVPTLVIVLIMAGRNLKTDHGVVTRIQEAKFELTDLLAILVISFLYLAHDFNWYISLFASGLCVLIAINLRNYCKTRILYLRSVIALTALATALMLAGIRIRSPFWWINSDDYQLFESMQISLARYGPRDQLGATGISLTSYHFLSYAWTGLVDRVSAAPTWVILNRVSPVVVSVIVSALVWSFLSREGVHRPNLRFLLACIYPILFVFSFGSPSSAVGHIFLLAAVFYWTDRSSAQIHWSRIPMGVLFTVFLIGTKISNTPIIFLGLGALALVGIATNQSWKWVSLADLLIAMATGALYYILLLQYTTTKTSMEVEPFGFAKQIFGDLNELNSRWLVVIGGITTSAYMITPLLGVIIFWSYRKSHSSMLGYFLLPTFPLLALYLLFIGGHGASASYFMNSVLSVLLLIVLVAIYRSQLGAKPISQDFFQIKVFSFVGLVAGVASYYLLEHLNSGGRTAMFGRAIANAHWILIAVIGLSWFVFDTRKPKEIPRIMTLLSLILVGEIVASTTVAAIDLYQTARQPHTSASNVESVIGAPDEIAAGDWISSNLPINTIIASNHFCDPKECFGPNWFNEQVDHFRKNADLLKNEWQGEFGLENCSECGSELFGGTNFILPAYSNRRFLIQGPRFLWGLSVPPEWAIDRMNATLGFVNNPTENTLMALRKFDVEYFVVDRQATARKSWAPFGSVLYQNQSFAILQLADVL